MSSSVGIDVSKDQLDVVVMQAEVEQHLKVENAPKGYKALVKNLHRLGVKDGRVCMEATGTYYEGVAQHLHEAGYRVSVVNPAWIKDRPPRCLADCRLLPHPAARRMDAAQPGDAPTALDEPPL